MKRSCNGEWSSSLLESVRDAMPHIGDPLNHDRMARLHLLTQYPASDEECVARVRSAVRDARPELLPETQRVDMS